MPSTRKQKAKEKRSRQSDVMSDIENLDVMLGAYSRNDLVEDENNTEPEVDLESGRHQRSEGQTENNFRSLLNTNPSENSEVTVETNRLINSEISSQMSRKLEELKTDLNSHILDVINSALEERVLPSIKNALETKNSAKNVNLDLRSDGPHSNDFSQERAQRDLRSYGRHLENPTQRFQDAQNDFPRLETMRNNRINHCRRNSIDSNNSNENDDGYDMVTGANLTPQMVPEFLTGRPTQSRNTNPHQQCVNDDTLDNTLPAQIPSVPINNQRQHSETPLDPINRLADVIIGMNNKSSAQTLMVRPVNTATLTFDGKSEKFELFEDLFHTMIKMQPDMTETMRINHFHSLLRKNALQTFRNISSANRQTLDDILAVFRRKYVKPESQATAKHKWHKLVFNPNTMKLPDFLEELNQGAEKAFGEHAQAMIDSLLYAKLPPKLKRSVNMARLENATYEEIVTHLERELELNGLEEGDDIPVPTMSTAPTTTRPGQGLLSSGIDTGTTCNYCKKPGHVKDECRKLKRKEEQKRNEGQSTKKEYPKCPTCDKTNHPAERCWKGAGAHLKPKNLKLDNSTSDDTTASHDDSNNKTTTSILKNSKN